MKREHERPIRRPGYLVLVSPGIGGRGTVATERFEARREVGNSCLLPDVNDSECVDVREKATEEMVQPTHAAEERRRPGRVEANVHHVSLRGGDDDALDPCLVAERAHVGRDDLHSSTTEG